MLQRLKTFLGCKLETGARLFGWLGFLLEVSSFLIRLSKLGALLTFTAFLIVSGYDTTKDFSMSIVSLSMAKTLLSYLGFMMAGELILACDEVSLKCLRNNVGASNLMSLQRSSVAVLPYILMSTIESIYSLTQLHGYETYAVSLLQVFRTLVVFSLWQQFREEEKNPRPQTTATPK
jgi:hypothetical protein